MPTAAAKSMARNRLNAAMKKAGAPAFPSINVIIGFIKAIKSMCDDEVSKQSMSQHPQAVAFEVFHGYGNKIRNARIRARVKKSLPKAQRSAAAVDEVLRAAVNATPAEFAAAWDEADTEDV